MQTVFSFFSFSMHVLFPSWDATQVQHCTQSPRLLVCLAVDAFSVPPCFPLTDSVNRTSLVLFGPPLSSDLCDRIFLIGLGPWVLGREKCSSYHIVSEVCITNTTYY